MSKSSDLDNGLGGLAVHGKAPRVVGRRYRCGASQGCAMTAARVGLRPGSSSSMDETRSFRAGEKWDGNG